MSVLRRSLALFGVTSAQALCPKPNFVRPQSHPNTTEPLIELNPMIPHFIDLSVPQRFSGSAGPLPAIRVFVSLFVDGFSFSVLSACQYVVVGKQSLPNIRLPEPCARQCLRRFHLLTAR